MRNSVIIAIFVIASCNPAPSQIDPKTTLVGEFADENCHSLIGWFDSLLADMSRDPDSSGYVVLFEKRGHQLQTIRLLSDLRGQLAFRGLPPDHFNLLLGPERESRRGELWKVEKGGAKPPFPAAEWRLRTPITDRVLFYDSATDGGNCHGDYHDAYFQLLMANPDLRGEVVIGEPSARKFRRMRKELLDEHKQVPPNRLRFDYSKSDFGRLELWLEPLKH